MKRINKTQLPVLLISAVLALCGCSDENSPQDGLAAVPLGVGSLSLEARTATRAGGTPVSAEGAAVQVFLTNEGGYAPVYGKTYTCTGGKWGSNDPVYVDNRTGKALGVYDPNHLVTFGANSTVTTNALQAQAYRDNLLWYYDNAHGTNVNSTSPLMNFSMTCAYSRMAFSITHDAGYPLACKVSRITVKPATGNFYTNARVDIADGALTGTAVTEYSIDTSTLPMNTSGIAVGTTDNSVDHLFPGQTLAAGAGLTFVLTVDGAGYSVTVPSSTLNEIKAGMHYTVQLAMTGQGILVSGVSVAGWNPSSTNVDSHFD